MYKEKKLKLKDWSHNMLYKGVVEVKGYPFPQINQLCCVSERALRNEFLKLVECKADGDYYMLDIDAINALTPDKVDLLLKVQHRKRQSREQKGRYIVEYISKTEPVELMQSDVEIHANKFMGEDGQIHNIKERGCRIVETILRPHTKSVPTNKELYAYANEHET